MDSSGEDDEDDDDDPENLSSSNEAKFYGEIQKWFHGFVGDADSEPKSAFLKVNFPLF